MSAGYQRRQRDPQPMGQSWEVAFTVLATALLGLGFAALVGLAAASAVAGGGWVWPHGTDTIGQVLAGLLTGHPGRGLPPAQATKVAGPVAVYGCITGCELALIAAVVSGGVGFARYHRPGDARGGMATRREAEQVLGLSQLHQAKALIRPDLYGADTGKEHRR